MEFNCFMFNMSLFVDGHLYIILLVIFALCAAVFFIKLQLIDCILRYDSNNRINFSNIKRFMQNHSMVVVDILEMNKLISRVLFAYIIGNLPLNIFLVTSNQYSNIGRGNKLLVVFCALMIFQQMIGLIFLHLICALYTKKIHLHSKRLIGMNVKSKYPSLLAKLRVSLFIEKFHTENCYGITYFNFGLITISTFAKVK